MKPLAGIRVIEMARGVAGITAGSIMVDLGADVLRPGVAREDGIANTGTAGELLAAARMRGKTVAAVGGNGQQARERALDLALGADILLEPEDDPEFGAEARRRHPGLISCATTAWGLSGPWSGRPGSELAVQALTGALNVTGTEDRPAVRSGIPLAEDAAGLFAAIGVLAALRWQRRTGQGQRLDIAACDCLTVLMPGFLTTVLGGNPMGRQGNRHPSVSPWNAYPTLDGPVLVCTVSDGQWAQLAELMGRSELVARPDFLTVPDRRGNAAYLDVQVSAWTRQYSADQVVDLCRSRGLPAGKIATIDDVVRDCRDLAPGSVRVHHEDGRMTVEPCLWLRDELAAECSPIPTGNAAQDSLASAPLDDITIVEMAQFTSGPFVTRILSWLGARVIKVEPSSGDDMRRWAPHVAGLSYFFQLNNAGKLSVEIDAKSEAGHQALLALVDGADAFISNFGPGVIERLGFGSRELLERNPRLIVSAVSGYEPASVLARDKAFDTVAQAQSGIMSVTGWPDGPPVKSGLSASDVISATVAALKVMAGLLERDRTGRGCAVLAPLLNTSMWATRQWWPLALTDSDPERRRRVGNRDPYWPGNGVFDCADGRLAVGVASVAQWSALLRVLPLGPQARLELADVKAALTQHDLIDAALEQLLRSLPIDAAVELLHDAGVPAAPQLSLVDALDQPHLRYRGVLAPVAQPDGIKMRLTDCPIKFSGFETRVGGFMGHIGDDTRTVLGRSIDSNLTREIS